MKYRLEERRENNKGLPNFRPWRILTADGRLVRCYTTNTIAQVALAMLEAGAGCDRKAIYRRIRNGQA